MTGAVMERGLPPQPARPSRKPDAPKPGRPPDRTFVAELGELDDRILVERVPAWEPVGCDLCGYLDCVGDVRVVWTSRFPGVDNDWHVNANHLDGWVTGFLIPDAAPGEQIRIEVPA